MSAVGQPKTQRGRETRAAIVRAAAQLMYERGVRATSLDDVLAAAGAGKSQLYHYFETKEDLAGAVLEHQLAEVLQQQGAFRLDTWTGLRKWFRALVDGQRARAYQGCPVGSMAAELSAIDDDMAARVGTAFAHWQLKLAEAFTEMRRRGALAQGTPIDRLAAVTLAQIQGGYLLSTASQTIEPMAHALDAAYAALREHRT